LQDSILFYVKEAAAFLLPFCAAPVGGTSARYTTDGFIGIYDDVMYLSMCDYIVGTFSSQVSRMAYEVSLVNSTLGGPDRTFAYHSVDSMWYYGGMVGFIRCAAADFTAQGHVVVKAGQQLRCATIHEFDQRSGHEICKPINSEVPVYLPPGSVVDCPAKESKYRPILPERMRPPVAAAAAAKAADAGAVIAAAAAGDGTAGADMVAVA
jgi:glycoprotein 6-alpha-L-fucosyltransferase